MLETLYLSRKIENKENFIFFCKNVVVSNNEQFLRNKKGSILVYAFIIMNLVIFFEGVR